MPEEKKTLKDSDEMKPQEKAFKWSPKRLLIVEIPLLGLIVGCLYLAGSRYRLDNAVALVMMFPVFGHGFGLLDVLTYSIRKKENLENRSNSKIEYHPNLQIWGIGLISGAGMAVLGLLANTVMIFLNIAPTSSVALVQNIAVLILLAVSFGFIIWAIVKIGQGI